MGKRWNNMWTLMDILWDFTHQIIQIYDIFSVGLWEHLSRKPCSRQTAGRFRSKKSPFFSVRGLKAYGFTSCESHPPWSSVFLTERISNHMIFWLVVYPPLWKMMDNSSVGMISPFPTYGQSLIQPCTYHSISPSTPPCLEAVTSDPLAAWPQYPDPPYACAWRRKVTTKGSNFFHMAWRQCQCQTQFANVIWKCWFGTLFSFLGDNWDIIWSPGVYKSI